MTNYAVATQRIGYVTTAVTESPMLESERQNQKCPTTGPDGYISTAVCNSPDAWEYASKSETAHEWAQCLNEPYYLRGHPRFRAQDNIRNGPQVEAVAISSATRGISDISQAEMAQNCTRLLYKLCCLRGPRRIRSVAAQLLPSGVP